MASPFIKDDSLVYFLQNAGSLKPVTLVMIAIGGLIAFWVPYRSIERSKDPAMARGVGGYAGRKGAGAP